MATKPNEERRRRTTEGLAIAAIGLAIFDTSIALMMMVFPADDVGGRFLGTAMCVVSTAMLTACMKVIFRRS